MADLYRLSNAQSKWAVLVKKDVVAFETIEQASDYMVSIGIVDDEIDEALIDMVGNDHTHAQFGTNGYFIFSSDQRYIGNTGVA